MTDWSFGGQRYHVVSLISTAPGLTVRPQQTGIGSLSFQLGRQLAAKQQTGPVNYQKTGPVGGRLAERCLNQAVVFIISWAFLLLMIMYL